jgi:hypothetical protein
MGKGATVRRGIQEASGEFVMIQNADLEYDPIEYPNLLALLLKGKADVVYGSGFNGRRTSSCSVLLAFGRHSSRIC